MPEEQWSSSLRTSFEEVPELYDRERLAQVARRYLGGAVARRRLARSRRDEARPATGRRPVLRRGGRRQANATGRRRRSQARGIIRKTYLAPLDVARRSPTRSHRSAKKS
jgi:hypothetical protein